MQLFDKRANNVSPWYCHPYPNLLRVQRSLNKLIRVNDCYYTSNKTVFVIRNQDLTSGFMGEFGKGRKKS
ncbi:hypothetical protein QE152_g40317 [Popillia japonica]|uniref:Ribosomal protein S19 n=1 Tax=Popillia japonica TaxID=7064 RepID=A0AAW1HRJ0_POPJA